MQRQMLYDANYKRILIKCLLLLSCLLTISQVATAQETGFLTPGKSTFLYLDTRVLEETFDNEAIKFVLQNDGVLRLISRDGANDYLSFTGYDGTNAGIGYKIRKIFTTFPSMEFFEIIADRGAHAKNCGYWIIGKSDGKWVTYVSIDSLANMGYTPGEWHRISTQINADSTGRFILTSSHEYMPPGAKYGYQRKHAVDLRLQLLWDQKARWFAIRKL